MADNYRRKISGEEARERYIMIMKNALDLFPKIGKPFRLKINDHEIETRVDAVECWCMGPKKPHSHYRIDAKKFWDVFPLHFGKTVTITKEDETIYSLSA